MAKRATRIVIGGAVAVGLALVVRVPAPGLADALSGQATSWGLTVASAGASVGLLTGTRLEGVRVELATPDARLDVDARRVLARHAWAFRRPLVVDRLRWLDADVRLDLGPPEEPTSTADSLAGEERDDGAPSAPGPESSAFGASSWVPFGAGSWFVFDRVALDLERATLAVHARGELVVEAVGLASRLADFTRIDEAGSPLQAMSAEGGFAADVLRLGLVTLEAAEGRVALERGVLRVSDFRFVCGGSELRIPELEVDLINPPLSVTTRQGIEERPRGSGADWDPLASLTLLGGRCR